MILGDDDIKAIADEVMRRMEPWLREISPSQRVVSYARQEEVRLEVQQMLRRMEEKRAEEARLDQEIRDRSQKMPADLRPVPEQYKSRRRKELVLELVKDPTRWEQVPLLSKQWPSIPRKKSGVDRKTEDEL